MSEPSAETLREVLAWLFEVADAQQIDTSAWPAFWATNAMIMQIAHLEGKSIGDVGDSFRRATQR